MVLDMKCKRCGRILKNKESIKLEYGKVCYKKFKESMLNQNTKIQYLKK